MTQQRRTTPLARTCRAPHACPRPLRLEVLSHAPYFAGLSRGELEAVDRRMRVRGYAQGEVVHRAGEPATHLFVLAAGRLKVLRPALDRADALVDVITPGALFGSVSALGHSTHPDTAESLTVSCVLSLSAADFRAVLHDHPDVALAVLDDVAHRLEQTRETVRRLSGGTVEQRIAATLLTLADRIGEQRGDAVLIQLPLSRADLAAMTGTTTESVSRTLSRLRRTGLVDAGRRWISVTDRGRLAELARE